MKSCRKSSRSPTGSLLPQLCGCTASTSTWTRIATACWANKSWPGRLCVVVYVLKGVWPLSWGVGDAEQERLLSKATLFTINRVRTVFEGLWKFRKNGISFSRPWKSVKTEWGLWKFVNFVVFRALGKNYQLISQKLHFPRPNGSFKKISKKIAVQNHRECSSSQFWLIKGISLWLQ